MRKRQEGRERDITSWIDENKQRERHTQRDTHRETHTERHTQRDTESHRETWRNRETKKTETVSYIVKQRGTERQRETDR